MHIFHKKLNLKKEKRNKKENKTKNKKQKKCELGRPGRPIPCARDVPCRRATTADLIGI
jgi:hypothetical protein